MDAISEAEMDAAVISDTQPTSSPRKTSFAGDVLKLVSGTTIAQVIGILVTPILTRLYAPEAFGLLAMFTSLTSVLGVIACMRYELAIMLPESDEEAASLLAVSLGFTLLLAISMALIVWFGRTPLLRFLDTPELVSYIWMVPPMVLLTGTSLALNYWNTRKKQFGRLSMVRVTRAVGTHLVKLGSGVLGNTTGGMLIGATVVGQAVATSVLSIQIWQDDRGLFRRAIHGYNSLDAIRRHSKFPRYSIWSALLNSVSWQLPVFFLSSFFSAEEVGYYALGFRVIHTPMSLIGNSISQVFYQRAVEAKFQGRLLMVAKSALRWLVMMGLFPMLMLTFIAPDLFAVIFGAGWVEAGHYTQILSIWAFFWFVSSPLSNLFSVIEKQEYGLRIQVAIFVSRLISLFVGGKLFNARTALVLFSASGVLVYGYLGVWVMRLVGVTTGELARLVGNYMLLFVPAGGILLLLKLLNADVWVMLIVALLCGIAYALYLVRHEPQLNIFSNQLRADKIAAKSECEL